MSATAQTPATPIGGRPASYVRLALLAALQAGAVGTFDAIARHAGVPERQARQTLANLRRAGVVQSHRPDCTACAPQRTRHIYAPSQPSPHIDALRFVAAAWR